MRIDQRKPNQLRPLKITKDYLLTAEGSVLIEVGNTQVLCAASIEDTVPHFLRNSGKGWVTAEYSMLPRATATRTPRSLSLTDDGTLFYSRCTQILDDLEEAESAMAARSAVPTGALRLSVPTALGHRHVMPVLESFLKAWPAVSAVRGM